MLNYYDEFKESFPHEGSLLSKMQNNEKNFMSNSDESLDDIKKFLGREGYIGFTKKRAALMKYLNWLFNTYNIDTSNLNFKIESLTKDDVIFEDVYIFSLSELHDVVEATIEEAYLINEAKDSYSDFEGLRAYFLLQWYNIDIDNFVQIKLHEISDNGRKIYISSENHTIVLDEKTARIINEYKLKEGYSAYSKGKSINHTYKQNTLFRTYRHEVISSKNIYNCQKVFSALCPDARLRKGRILSSGRYYQLLKTEELLGREIMSSDVDIIGQIFKTDAKNVWKKVQDFKQYKKKREEYLSAL